MGMVDNLKKVGDWGFWDDRVKHKKSGSGLDELKENLPEDNCGFIAIYIEPTKDDGKIIILSWKGPKSSLMRKVHNNNRLDIARNTIRPTQKIEHGIDIFGTQKLTMENILAKVANSGSEKQIIGAD